MAKKSRASKKGLSKPSKPKKEVAPVSKSEYEHLAILLKFTERAIDGRGGGIDEFFTAQAKKLRAEMEAIQESEARSA